MTARKRPNPADLTKRNNDARKKVEAGLMQRVAALETRNRKFADRLQALEEGRPRPSRFLKRAKA